MSKPKKAKDNRGNYWHANLSGGALTRIRCILNEEVAELERLASVSWLCKKEYAKNIAKVNAMIEDINDILNPL